MVDAPPSIPLPTCMVEAAQIYHILSVDSSPCG